MEIILRGALGLGAIAALFFSAYYMITTRDHATAYGGAGVALLCLFSAITGR